MARTDTVRRARVRAVRRERTKGHVRAGILQLGAAVGLLLALPRALSHTAVPDACTEPGRCVADAVTGALMPMVLYIGAGVIAGATVALLVCLTVPGLKRREL